jgi:4-hydroxy-tetrahydrodipicolinate synthase
MFKGSFVAMITPFTKNDEVNEKGISGVSYQKWD